MAHPSADEVIAIDARLKSVGLLVEFHVLPFQCNIVPLYPTAQPSVAEIIEMESSSLNVGEDTLAQ
jgi:hypothetical protein